MEQPNFKKDAGTEISSLGRIREAIDGKMLKILGPVAFATLLSSCGESERQAGLKSLEGKPGIESVDKATISQVQEIIDFAKQQKKIKFEEGKSTDSYNRRVDVDTISNSVSYTEKLSSYNEESKQVDHHEVHAYYSLTNRYFQFFGEETEKKAGEELPKIEQSILADDETGIILKAASFEAGEPELKNIYVLDGAVGPFGNKDVVPEAVDMAHKRLSSVRELIGPVYNPQTNEFENLDGTPLPNSPEINP